MTARLISPRSASLALPRYSTVDARTPSIHWPSEADKAPTHCGHCGARLLRAHVPTADAPLVDVECYLCSRTAVELKHDSLRKRMTPAEWAALPVDQPRRGRPPLKPPAMKPCPECGEREIRSKNERCLECWRKIQGDRSLASRIVAVLREGPRQRADLCEMFGVGVDFLRQGVNNARNSGHAIVLDRSRCLYRLEGAV